DPSRTAGPAAGVQTLVSRATPRGAGRLPYIFFDTVDRRYPWPIAYPAGIQGWQEDSTHGPCYHRRTAIGRAGLRALDRRRRSPSLGRLQLRPLRRGNRGGYRYSPNRRG